MKIELRITREDGRYLKYGEATAAGVPDSEIVLQTLLQHVQATATKVRTDMARGVKPVWQDPEVSIDVVLDQTLNHQEAREVPIGEQSVPSPLRGNEAETGPGYALPADDEPATPSVAFYTSDDEPFIETPAPTAESEGYDGLRREDVQAEEGDLVGDPLMPQEQSFEDPTPAGSRAPRTRPGRGRAVKDSPQA